MPSLFKRIVSKCREKQCGPFRTLVNQASEQAKNVYRTENHPQKQDQDGNHIYKTPYGRPRSILIKGAIAAAWVGTAIATANLTGGSLLIGTGLVAVDFLVFNGLLTREPINLAKGAMHKAREWLTGTRDAKREYTLQLEKYCKKAGLDLTHFDESPTRDILIDKLAPTMQGNISVKGGILGKYLGYNRTNIRGQASENLIDRTTIEAQVKNAVIEAKQAMKEKYNTMPQVGLGETKHFSSKQYEKQIRRGIDGKLSLTVTDTYNDLIKNEFAHYPGLTDKGLQSIRKDVSKIVKEENKTRIKATSHNEETSKWQIRVAQGNKIANGSVQLAIKNFISQSLEGNQSRSDIKLEFRNAVRQSIEEAQQSVQGL